MATQNKDFFLEAQNVVKQRLAEEEMKDPDSQNSAHSHIGICVICNPFSGEHLLEDQNRNCERSTTAIREQKRGGPAMD